MARIRIHLPQHFNFTTIISVRITDINYGGHVGNDSVLSFLHEARMQFLKHYGYSEMNLEGVSMIMSDVAIEFKNELFYEDIIKAYVAAGEFSPVSFAIYYKLEKQSNNKSVVVALAKTGMVCYDYTKKKITTVPEKARLNLESIV